MPIRDENLKKTYRDVYMEIPSISNIREKCQEMLDDYNLMYMQNRMTLVLFTNAIEHITRYPLKNFFSWFRIVRII